MSSVLVTGGAGFLGSFLAERLVNEGHDVTILDDFSRGSPEKLAPSVRERAELIRFDGLADDYTPYVKEAELIVHLAAINGTRYFYEIPERVLTVNVQALFRVLEALESQPPRRLLFASSSEVYGMPNQFPTPETAPIQIPDILNPRYSYAASKITGEAAVVHAASRLGTAYTICRYHNVYGPNMGEEHVIPQFILRLLRNEPFTVLGDGSETRSFCYVTDAVECTYRALTADAGADRIFNVGNPEETSILDLIDVLSRIAGREIQPEFTPFPQAGTQRRVPDISRARDQLRYEPRVPLETGLRETYDWYRGHHR